MTQEEYFKVRMVQLALQELPILYKHCWLDILSVLKDGFNMKYKGKKSTMVQGLLGTG